MMQITTIAKKFNPAEYFREFDFADYLRFDFTKLRGDLTGGLTSAIVALPLALGFGILATGGDPRGAVAGLYGAVFTGIVASLFGGTPQQITGPTGGMTVILTEVYLQTRDVNALLAACLIAGLIQVAFGLLKLGRFISFVPQPVISGFTNGIAVLIFIQQLPAVCAAPVVALATIAFILLTQIANRSLPKLFIGLLAGTVATYLLWDKLPPFLYRFDPQALTFAKADAIKVVGAIPHTFRLPAVPITSWGAWRTAIPAGFTIAILGCLETLLASVVVDTVTNGDHNSNRELVGQGAGNAVASLFGGIAGTGAIVRTMINIRSGGVTKLSGVICGLVLALVVLFLSPLAAHIPLAALAGVLLMAAIGMFEWEPVKLLPKTPFADGLVFVTTMAVTVFADLISAVLIGMLMATFLFINRVSKLGVIPAMERTLLSIPEQTKRAMQRHRVSVFGIEGPLFFGAVKSFSKEITNAAPDALILDMKGVSIIDQSGAAAIEAIIHRMKQRKKTVLLCGMRPEVRKTLHALGVVQSVGADSFPDTLDKAIDYALARAQARQPGLADYLKQDLILLDADLPDKAALFETAAARAEDGGYVFDKKAFLDNLWLREQDSPTSLGHGVGIPHSRSGAATDEVVVIFVRPKKPLADYGTIDGRPVDLVLMISAGDNVEGYLKVLKLIAQAVGREEVRRQLLSARTPAEVAGIFSSIGD
ncbi:MAG: SulP family inorganic anion transporter [Candidatus Edwardsbacteria bacterium]|jgi:SulP family sulfate permease|nr:SulP family inorganic anion transporter [Candidatus Edwardsbacteria bacterium]